MELNIDAIPAQLKAADQWVVWHRETRDGKTTKIPYTVDGEHASTTDPATWTGFDQVVQAAARLNGNGGIGFVFSDSDEFTFIDLDHCIDPATGEIAPWAQSDIDLLDSYSEVSPGGDGIHIIVEASKPGPRCKSGIDAAHVSPMGAPAFELYEDGRFATFTGNHVVGTPTTVEKRQHPLDMLYAAKFPPKPTVARNPSTPVDLDDVELIEKALAANDGGKFARLWNGDASGYPSASEASAALLVKLAFWTGHDAAQMDRLFRQSGLMREKFDTPRGDTTWGWKEIDGAIDLCDETYSPPATGMRRPAPGHEASSDAAVPDSAPPPRPFPISGFSAAVRDLITEGAMALGVPTDFIGVPLLALAGGTIGRTYQIEIKPDYRIYPNLWTALVAPPGSGKTPAANLARFAVDQLQEAAVVAYDAEMDQFKRDVANWRDAEQGERDAKPDEPVLESLFTTDATIEAISELLNTSTGFTFMRDEIVGWVRSFDQYRGGRGADRQNWLSLWSGTPIKVDRKKSTPIFIRHPVVSVTGGVQPDMLDTLADEAGRQDGFLDRLLWSYPKWTPTGWNEASVRVETKLVAADLFTKIRGDGTVDQVVYIDPPAKKLWIDWYGRNQALIEQAPGLLQGVYSKLPIQLARLALILWCFRYPEDPTKRALDAMAMADAIELVEYFRAHAHRVMESFGVAATVKHGGLAARCHRILESANGWVGSTEVNNGLGGHTAADDYRAALDELVKMGLAQTRSLPAKGGKGGRSSTQWRVADQPDLPEKPPDPAQGDGVDPVSPVFPQAGEGEWGVIQ